MILLLEESIQARGDRIQKSEIRNQNKTVKQKSGENRKGRSNGRMEVLGVQNKTLKRNAGVGIRDSEENWCRSQNRESSDQNEKHKILTVEYEIRS